MGYDVIGDLHAQVEKLTLLLDKLGYKLVDGIYRHPTRTAIFVGDFIDRGAWQLATLKIVRDMVEAGAALAVMGNHEFNAIAFALKDPLDDTRHLRKRSRKNRMQHDAFLAEVGCDTELHLTIIEWFMTLPLWLDLPGLRVVHACWDQASIDAIKPYLNIDNCLNKEVVEMASREGSALFEAVEKILKGPEVHLPIGTEYQDSDGNTRKKSRIRWWDKSAVDYKTAAIVNPRVAADLPDMIIPEHERVSYDGAKPLFIGHYWMTGLPRILNGKIACVDYSAAKHGDLMAYRWDGEDILDDRKFFSSAMTVKEGLAQ